MKYEKLPQDFKQKWIEALRSGEYKQGVYKLRNVEDKYCCLGVACLVATGIKPPINVQFIEPNCKIKGIKKVPNILKGGCDKELIDFLSAKNDHGWSFKRIATWINENL